MTPGLAVASGNWGVDLPSNAYDADSVTAWVANCPDSCNQTRPPFWLLKSGHVFLHGLLGGKLKYQNISKHFFVCFCWYLLFFLLRLVFFSLSKTGTCFFLGNFFPKTSRGRWWDHGSYGAHPMKPTPNPQQNRRSLREFDGEISWKPDFGFKPWIRLN